MKEHVPWFCPVEVGKKVDPTGEYVRFVKLFCFSFQFVFIFLLYPVPVNYNPDKKYLDSPLFCR